MATIHLIWFKLLSCNLFRTKPTGEQRMDDDDTYANKMEERGRERERGHCAAAHTIKPRRFRNNILFHYAHSTLQWFCSILYTHQNTNYVLSCSMLSLSSELFCFSLHWSENILRLSLRVRSNSVWWGIIYSKIPLFSPLLHSPYFLSFHFIYLSILRYRVSIYMIVPPYTSLNR